MTDRPGPSRNRDVAVFAATVAVFFVFDAVAISLHSDRGQWGVLICAIVIGALVAVERFVIRAPLRDSTVLRALRRPARAGLIAATVVSAALLGVLFFAWTAADVRVTTLPGWHWMLPGLFAQAGLAEESLFRGFLFARLRERRSFARAATLSLVPFVLAHLVLFARMPWPIALAAVLLSVAMTYPLAHLFEIGGGTIWAPAILHFVVQGALKVTVASGQNASVIPIAWMVASAIVPYAVFFLRSGRVRVSHPRESESKR